MIRRGRKEDLDRIRALLFQVHDVHATIRPDLFVKGARKYDDGEILEILENDETPIYVFDDEEKGVLGYAFCVLQVTEPSTNLVGRRALYIDDLCVDEAARGTHVGEALYHFVKEEAKRLSCNSVLLNVWEGNDRARGFYEHMGMKPLKTYMEEIL